MPRWLPAAMILGGLVFLEAGSAQALSSESVSANVPFDFKVGSATLPAGQYRVSYDAGDAPGVLSIRSRDGRHQALVLAGPVDATKATTEGRLVFEREGTAYRLSEVFAPTAHVGLEVLGMHAAG